MFQVFKQNQHIGHLLYLLTFGAATAAWLTKRAARRSGIMMELGGASG
jgi:hypothetical protein